MKHEIGTVIEQLPGGNKYRVIEISEQLYRLECIDYWCSEDLGDQIMCWGAGERHWVAAFHADFWTVNTSSFYQNT